jgi:hypothetical protein
LKAFILRSLWKAIRNETFAGAAVNTSEMEVFLGLRKRKSEKPSI